MTVFRENILDIFDNWGGYYTEVPCVDFQGGERIPGIKPAQNAGTVELKCFINNTCPFYSSG